MIARKSFIYLVVWCLIGATTSHAAPASFDLPSASYHYQHCGSKDDAIRPKTRAGLLLMGGGDFDIEKDPRHKPPAWIRWFSEHARGGDLVILGAKNNDVYLKYFCLSGRFHSVHAFITITSEAANSPAVATLIRRAEAIFIKGGDQSFYHRLWSGSLLAKTVEERVNAGVPLGGTSAGLAVMSEHVFYAGKGTVYSADALKDPFHERVTLEWRAPIFRLPLMTRILNESHFRTGDVEENHPKPTDDRMGRLVTFLARLTTDRPGVNRAIALEDATELLVELPSGASTVVGEGAAYFLTTSGKAPEICRPGQPLTFLDIKVMRLSSGGRFQVKEWQTREKRFHEYVVSARGGSLSGDRFAAP